MTNSVETLSNILDPVDTSTGGGSASALAGAMAGALIDMVCRLPVKNETESLRQYLDDSARKAGELSAVLQAGADNDRAAFQAVRDAFKLPKTTEEQTAARSIAVQVAWVNAARVPLDNAGNCAELAALVCELNGKTNPNAQSDLICAYFLARAGSLGCLENVAINLPSIKNFEIVTDLQDKAGEVSKRLNSLKDPSQ